MPNEEFLFNHRKTDYIIHLDETPGNITVVLEISEESHYWLGEFDKQFIETATTVAGSAKTLETFIKILKTALNKESQSVFIDISERTMGDEPRERVIERIYDEENETGNEFKCRYLTLTYVSEFENIYYPLRLVYQENPDELLFRRTIQRLRNSKMKALEYLAAKTHMRSFCACCKENDKLSEENIKLREKLRMLNDEIAASFKEVGPYKKGVFTKEDFIQKVPLENEYQSQLSSFLTKDSHFTKAKKQYEGMIGDLNSLINLERSKFGQFMEAKNNELTTLRTQLKDLQKEMPQEGLTSSSSKPGQLNKTQSNSTVYSNYNKNINRSISRHNKRSLTNQSLMKTNQSVKNVKMDTNPNHNSSLMNFNKSTSKMSSPKGAARSTQNFSHSPIANKKIVTNEEINEKLRKIENLLSRKY